ncbi:hypothetical protein Tco_0767003 [Tanacetum coccineum]
MLVQTRLQLATDPEMIPSSVRQTKDWELSDKSIWQDDYKAKVEEGIDFEESFALFSLRSIRNFVAYAAHKSFQSNQWTRKRHFFNGPLKRRLLFQPEGFVDPEHPTKSILLRKLCKD